MFSKKRKFWKKKNAKMLILQEVKKFLNSIILMLWYSLQNVGKETKLLIMVQGHPWSSIQNLQINLKKYFHMTNYKNDNSNKFQKVCRNFKMMTKFPKNYKVLNCWPSSNILPIADQFPRQYRRKRLCIMQTIQILIRSVWQFLQSSNNLLDKRHQRCW